MSRVSKRTRQSSAGLRRRHDRRVSSGIATTPEPDRMGDIIDPLGVQFKNPLPLLLYHDTKRPVGWTTFKKPTKDGVEFSARFPTIDDPGPLRDRVEEAWQSVKAGLISGVSIGFRALEQVFMPETQSFRFPKTEVMELSLVTIPANASATILSIKELDLAASGPHAPGVSGSLPVVRAEKAARPLATAGRPAPSGSDGRPVGRAENAARPMTIPEQITQFENTRAAKAARMNELMTKATETGSTLDDAQAAGHDQPHRR